MGALPWGQRPCLLCPPRPRPRALCPLGVAAPRPWAGGPSAGVWTTTRTNSAPPVSSPRCQRMQKAAKIKKKAVGSRGSLCAERVKGGGSHRKHG